MRARRHGSVVCGFYRTCTIDGVLEHSLAELTTARLPPNRNDFALVAILGLRIFEATGSDIADVGEEHGHRVLRGGR